MGPLVKIGVRIIKAAHFPSLKLYKLPLKNSFADLRKKTHILIMKSKVTAVDN